MLAAWARDPIQTQLQPDAWAAPATRTLAPHIPVLALNNVPRDPCGEAQLDAGSDACRLMLFGYAQQRAFMANMTSMTPGGAYAECGGAAGGGVAGGCSDWLGGGDTLGFVVSEVLAFLARVGA